MTVFTLTLSTLALMTFGYLLYLIFISDEAMAIGSSAKENVDIDRSCMAGIAGSCSGGASQGANYAVAR